MISIAGAALLATIFPIGILIVAVEARQLRRINVPPGDPYKSRQAYWANVRSWGNFVATVNVMGVMWPLWATVMCTVAVCTDKPMTGQAVVVVMVAAAFSIAAVFLNLVRLVSEPTEKREG